MTNTAHDERSSRRSHQAGTAALIAADAMLGASLYVQRHREELAMLGQQIGVPANPQT